MPVYQVAAQALIVKQVTAQAVGAPAQEIPQNYFVQYLEAVPEHKKNYPRTCLTRWSGRYFFYAIEYHNYSLETLNEASRHL
jgi:hypothetical protein